MKRIPWILLGGLIVAVLTLEVPVSRPRHRIGSGTFPIYSDWSLFPESLAANSGQNFLPHGAWFGKGTDAGYSDPGTLAGGASVPSSMYLPSPADYAYMCQTTSFYIITNTTGSNAIIQPYFGVNNPNENGCPMWPYYAGAGGHPNGPSGYAGFTIPAGQSIMGEVERADGIQTLSWGTCGSVPISSATYSGGTITLNFSTSQSIWCTGGCQDNYVQVNGSSVAALNTPAGTVLGTNYYQVHNPTSTSVQFSGTSSQACGSSCGTAYAFVAAGTPPYYQALGDNLSTTPAVGMGLLNSGSASVNFDLSVDTYCLPFVGNNMPPDSTAGNGANATGGMNGVLF
jgi:hypothetical protein